MNKEYINYLFEDEDSGELFFVEITKTAEKSYNNCLKEAIKTAKEYFNSPQFIKTVSEEMAEFYGFDTY